MSRPAKVTAAEVCQQYIAEKRNKVKASTLQRSEELLTHVVSILGPTQVARLRPTDISGAYRELEARLARRTIRHCHWQLHGALELAVRWGQIPVNVAGRVDRRSPRRSKAGPSTRTRCESFLKLLSRPNTPRLSG